MVDLHIEVDPEMSVRGGHDLASKVKFTLMEHFPDTLDVVVHVEPWEKTGTVLKDEEDEEAKPCQ
jgi:divalent metal cation (Fe/Co/Zn/Cd) transporter